MHASSFSRPAAPGHVQCWRRHAGRRATQRPRAGRPPMQHHAEAQQQTPRVPAAAGQGPTPSTGTSSSSPASDDEADWRLARNSLAVSLLGGLALALTVPVVDEALPAAVQLPSAALGWSYFLAWSISFWPQVLDNASRRSVAGLSPDYLVYSIIGYTAYTAYTAALYLSPGVQAAYMAAHGGSTPDVQLTDLLFAGHALAVSLLTLWQCVIYGDGGAGADPSSSTGSSSSRRRWLSTSPLANATALAVLGGLAGYGVAVGSSCAGSGDCGAWLPLLGFLGTTKVGMTLIKYTPQALLNAQRRSTSGWQINNVLLDLAGGLLSFGQIALNAAARGDAAVITGNPAKLGIAAVSLAFDCIFIVQHLRYSTTTSSSSSSAGGSEHDSLGRPAAASSAGRASRRLAAVAVNAAKSRR